MMEFGFASLKGSKGIKDLVKYSKRQYPNTSSPHTNSDIQYQIFPNLETVNLNV